MIAPWFGRFEPLGRVLAGNDVSFDTKRRNEDIMNRVLSSHDQLDLAADRHVQLIDLSLSRRVLKLPHPLFADDIDFDRVLRRAIHLEVDLRAPDKECHGDD